MTPIRTALAAVLAVAAASVAAGAAGAKTPPERVSERGGKMHSYILLDRTGSMEGIWSEALGSVNAYAKEMAEPDGGREIASRITLAVFDAQDGLQFDVIRKGVDANRWRSVTNDDASPRGMTPLYDAIGRIVTLAEFDKPEKAVIVIMTDGEENSSRELTNAGAKAALDRARKHGWEVVFLGAEFAKFDDAEAVGQTSSRNMAVAKDQLGNSMRGLAEKSKGYASGASPTVEFNEADRAQAKEEDVKQRNGQSPNQR
jgi:hypothetical protein